METININKIPKPFLRWAGGKRWLLKHLVELVNIDNYNNYHEPFIGGGSVFFNFLPKNAFISDSNEWLIETYNAIKEDAEIVVEYLKCFKNTKEDYYKIRQQKYNNSSKRAAQFIYLNQMSFNGIFRVNLEGKYNVPYGNRINYQFDYDNLINASNSLKNTNINSQNFIDSLDYIRQGDLVFLDPPYTITHNHNGFIQYNQKIFSLEDQYRLSGMIDEIKNRNAYYILTNAAHIKVKEIFKKENDRLIELSRPSLVGGKKAKRESYSEYLFTNII